MDNNIEERDDVILQRVPPGDRWIFADGTHPTIYESLTDALEAWYQAEGETEFYINARKGIVERVVDEEEIEEEVVIKKFSLYGED
jgi:hypothetical protein